MGASKRTFRPGEYLFKEGDTPNHLYIIQSGTVEIRKKKGSAYIQIAKLYTNEVLGEMSFFDKLPRSASAVAVTKVEALEIDFASMNRVYRSTPDYMQKIISCIVDRLRRANDTIRRLQKQVQDTSNTEDPETDELDAALSDSDDTDPLEEALDDSLKGVSDFDDSD